jgi:hypothetical protein
MMRGSAPGCDVLCPAALVCDTGEMSDPETPGAVPPPPGATPTPPMGIPAQPPVGMGPTAQIPATQPGPGGAMPPGMPPGTHYEDPYGEPYPEDDTPWYKRPAALALLLIVLLALGALIAWLLLSGGDDDSASTDSSLLTIEVTDQDGAPIDTGLHHHRRGSPRQRGDLRVDPSRRRGARPGDRRRHRLRRTGRVRVGDRSRGRRSRHLVGDGVAGAAAPTRLGARGRAGGVRAATLR